LNSDQAANLRRIAGERQEKHARFISVSSGKGGVGKTAFAVCLASELFRNGKKTLLFDADLGLANIDVMLRLPPRSNIRDYLAGNASLSDVIVKTPLGFDLFPASSGALEMADISEAEFEKIKTVLKNLGEVYDYIIFDTGAGINANVHRFTRLADRMIIVTLPEPTAISDAYAFLKTAVRQYRVNAAYMVFNRVEEEAAALRIFENLKGVVKRFLKTELLLLGMLREDAQIKRSARSGKVSVFEGNSVFTGGVRRIAAGL
jgi:flagellar biosynthesis protein FlhG